MSTNSILEYQCYSRFFDQIEPLIYSNNAIELLIQFDKISNDMIVSMESREMKSKTHRASCTSCMYCRECNLCSNSAKLLMADGPYVEDESSHHVNLNSNCVLLPAIIVTGCSCLDKAYGVEYEVWWQFIED